MCNHAAAHHNKLWPCSFFDNKDQSQRLQRAGLVCRGPVQQKQMVTELPWVCVSQSKARSRALAAVTSAHREQVEIPFPRHYSRPESCLHGLQPACSLASKAQILNWLNLAKIKHFTLPMKVTERSLFLTIRCYILICAALRRSDTTRVPEISHERQGRSPRAVPSPSPCLGEHRRVLIFPVHPGAPSNR